MSSWLDHLLFGLVPGTCILCEAPTHRHLDLCVGCERDLPRVANPCRRCGLPIGTGDLCGRCINAPPPFSRCFAPFLYTWPVDRLVYEFKERNRIIIGKMLAHAVCHEWLNATPAKNLPDVLVPVPLHKQRLRERGFNQSLEIAEVLADRARLPLDSRLCRRIRHAEPQKTLGARERMHNLRGAFTLDKDPDGLHIAIVDDVVTTAATVGEIGRLLLTHGASSVQVIALARTPRPQRSR